MSLLTLAALYGVVGTGCVIARLSNEVLPSGRAGDALLLAVAWPLYGPLLLTRLESGSRRAGNHEVSLLLAMKRATAIGMRSHLPGEATIGQLAGGLRAAASKLGEIDELLTRPEFSEDLARTRMDHLRRRGATECAVSTASQRFYNIRRLRVVRDDLATQLDEVRELIDQLMTQLEVVRLAGANGDCLDAVVLAIATKVRALDQCTSEHAP